MHLADEYRALKDAGRRDLGGVAVRNLLVLMTEQSHLFLRSAETKPLKSRVLDKSYVAFALGNKISRAVNAALFISDPAELAASLTAFADGSLARANPIGIQRTLYTLTMSFCAANDLWKVGDKKTPATYFEFLIGHLFAERLGVNPRKWIPVPGEARSSLPTDYIFELGPRRANFHLPVKLSTRERVIQAWAHQRVIDGIYGVKTYRGCLVVLAETKLDQKTLEVVEICLPLQWRVYQKYIAELWRIYYIDPPARYADLAGVKPIGVLYDELD